MEVEGETATGAVPEGAEAQLERGLPEVTVAEEATLT
jgi:hypothetical protein